MIIGIFIFILSILMIELVLFIYRNLSSAKRAKIKKRLQKYTFVENDFGDILKKREYSKIPFLNKMFLSLTVARKLDVLIIQANTKYPLGFFVLLSALLAATGFLAGQFFLNKRTSKHLHFLSRKDEKKGEGGQVLKL